MTVTELAALYDLHANSLFAYLLPMLRDEADVQDVLQELFRDLSLHPDTLAGVGDERGFLLRWVHRRAIDQIRRRQTRTRHTAAFGEEAIENPFAPTEDPDESTFRAQLAEALDELPKEQRAVVQLKLWEHRTFDDIARILDIPANTAASRYRYGLDKLRTRLRPLYEEIG